MKDYKETLSKFDKDYYKNLVQEKVERYNEVGQVCRVSLRWRGKYYHLQLFFPGAKFPTRKEVEAQVHKVYPDAVVMVHYSSESNPNQPLIRVAEGNLIHGDYGNYIDGQKLPKNKEKKLVDVPYESLAHNANKEEFQLSGNTLNEDADPGTDLATLKAKKFNAKAKAESEKDLKDSIRGKVDMSKYYKFPLGNYKAEENKYYKGNPKGTPKKPKAGDVRPGVKCEDKSFVEFMKRIEHLPDVTKEAIKNCGDDPLVAKAALEISGLPK
tara:strand:- start:307 stop:1113 length:807 start_codon:yes stop_codon:yes gene_type:complete